LKCGFIPQVFPTVDFGAGIDVKASFDAQRAYSQGGPLVRCFFLFIKKTIALAEEIFATVLSTKDLKLTLSNNLLIRLIPNSTLAGLISGEHPIKKSTQVISFVLLSK